LLTLSGVMIPRSINWLALLLAAFTMLSVSVESCVAAKVVIEEDQPHALVSQDDHQELGKVASSTSVPDFACVELPRLLIAELRSDHREALIAARPFQQAPAGIRRHRWLCMDRC
jgi:hypothetical protein